MLYLFLADSVVVLHVGFVLFVAVGPMVAWRWPRLTWAHLPAMAWGVGTLTIGFPCPLTALEKALRRWGGATGYEGGFVDHYLEDVVFPQDYSAALRALAGLMIVAGYLGLRYRITPNAAVPLRTRRILR